MEFVSKYFALKNIYEHGGVYIHESIKILSFFGYLKYQNAFFSLIDKKNYSEMIFGAPKGNEAILDILNTYSDSWDKAGEYQSLSNRIAITLTAKYGIPQDGKARLFGETVSVLSPALSVVDTRFENSKIKCAFEHDFTAHAGEEEYVTIPRSALRVLMAPPPAPVKAAVGKSKREIELERELTDLKKSNTLKIMVKIREIGDGPWGPFLKKIYRRIVKSKVKRRKK